MLGLPWSLGRLSRVQAELRPGLRFLGAVPSEARGWDGEPRDELDWGVHSALPVAACFPRVTAGHQAGWRGWLACRAAPGLGTVAFGRACPLAGPPSAPSTENRRDGGRATALLGRWGQMASPVCACGFSRPEIGRWETRAKECSIQTCASGGKRLPCGLQALQALGTAASSPATPLPALPAS